MNQPSILIMRNLWCRWKKNKKTKHQQVIQTYQCWFTFTSTIKTISWMCGFNINKGQRSTWINFQWPSDTGIEQISVHSAKNQHHQRKPHIFHHATGTTIRQTGQNQNAGTTWSTRNLSEPLIGFASDLGASKPTHMPTNHNLVTPKANPFNTWLRVNSQPTFCVDQKMKKKQIWVTEVIRRFNTMSAGKAATFVQMELRTVRKKLVILTTLCSFIYNPTQRKQHLSHSTERTLKDMECTARCKKALVWQDMAVHGNKVQVMTW